MGKLNFRRVNVNDVPIIFKWLDEPFVREFWDNTKEHREDILKFVNGRVQPSDYCEGKYSYWLGLIDDEPFSMLMTIEETDEDDINQIKKDHLSKDGASYGLDYMIGNIDYFGKGFGSRTLVEFILFFKNEIDQKANTFLIDPAVDNPRATRVYLKAGFEYVGDFMMKGDLSGSGKLHHLLVKRLTNGRI